MALQMMHVLPLPLFILKKVSRQVLIVVAGEVVVAEDGTVGSRIDIEPIVVHVGRWFRDF